MNYDIPPNRILSGCWKERYNCIFIGMERYLEYIVKWKMNFRTICLILLYLDGYTYIYMYNYINIHKEHYICVYWLWMRGF